MPPIRKADIRPFGCYIQGKDLLGNDYFLFWGICFVGLLLSGAVPIFLLGPAYCGIGLCFLNRVRGYPVSFNTLFEGFDQFMPSLIAALCYTGLALVLAIPYLMMLLMGVVLIASHEVILEVMGTVVVAMAILYIIVVNAFFSCALLFSCLLIMEYKLEGWPAFQTAVRGIWKNFAGIFLASLGGQLMVLAGLMMCVVPGVLLLPMILAGHFVCYQKIFGGGMPIVAKPVPSPMSPDNWQHHN